MKDSDTNYLISRAEAGDKSAQAQLLMQHRERLKRMIAAFMDPRVSARIDPSDVVQETLASASIKLPAYLKHKPIDFYPWLRQIAKERLVDAHRRHIRSQRRSVAREHQSPACLPDASAWQIANRLVSTGTSPSNQAHHRELMHLIKGSIARMTESDRELILMRYVEKLTIDEISKVLAISNASAKSRVRRALERLSLDVGGGLEKER